jgi:hypothetical protein
MLTGGALSRYRPVKVRVVAMSDEFARRLDYESKLERNPAFIADLTEHGRRRAHEFLGIVDSPMADELTALPGRNIWGQWVRHYPPCLEY